MSAMLEILEAYERSQRQNAQRHAGSGCEDCLRADRLIEQARAELRAKADAAEAMREANRRACCIIRTLEHRLRNSPYPTVEAVWSVLERSSTDWLRAFDDPAPALAAQGVTKP